MIESLRLTDVLSFRQTEVALQPLNIFVGGNGSGKSNLLRCISLLSHLPGNLKEAGATFGNFNEFFCSLEDASDTLSLRTVFKKEPSWPQKLIHSISLQKQNLSFAVVSERLEEEHARSGRRDPFYFFSVNNGYGKVYYKQEPSAKDTLPSEPPRGRSNRTSEGSLTPKNYDFQNSIFSQSRGPNLFDQILSINERLNRMRVYGRWDTTPNGSIRLPKPTSLESDLLLPDGSNLALVYNILDASRHGSQLEAWMKKFNPRIQKIRAVVFGGQIQLYFQEQFQRESVAATAVSDGTLQFLMLLCVLLHPSPPPLICLEEPEISLHPDALTFLARLLREASERTQIIVTTHSDRLLNCFTDTPEVVLVTERYPATGATHFERQDAPRLKTFIQDFGRGLGDVWRSGQIGGGIY